MGDYKNLNAGVRLTHTRNEWTNESNANSQCNRFILANPTHNADQRT